MAIIVPTTGNVEDAQAFHQRLDVLSAICTRLHIDVMDGQFAPNQTPPLVQMDLPVSRQVDLHLMVERPVELIETIISLGPHLVILHAESQGDLAAMMASLQAVGIKAGLALLEPTQPETVKDLISACDHLLIFSGHLGYNGGQFQPEMLNKIAAVRAIKESVEISVDGGINLATAPLALSAGVDVLYVGGYISAAADPPAAYRQLSDLALT